MAIEALKMERIRSACWEKDCYVIVKPQSQGKKPDCKLLMSAQGYNKLGDMLWKQNEDMYKKIDEMYLYMYENFVN